MYPIGNIDARRYPKAVAAIKQKRRAGVRFTREGYPDFTPWMYREGRVPADVRITYMRNRNADFGAADKAMRKKLRDPRWERPDGYTWHHHEDVGRMILVRRELHNAVSHTGGIPHYRMTTGDYDAYYQVQK